MEVEQALEHGDGENMGSECCIDSHCPFLAPYRDFFQT